MARLSELRYREPSIAPPIPLNARFPVREILEVPA